MELYICDETFRQEAIIDTFTSVIWTERYGSQGDITIVAPDTVKNRKFLKEFKFARVNGSEDIMILETSNVKDDQITIKGVSLLSFLKQRFFRDTWTDAQGWIVDNLPVYTMINQVLAMCVNPGSRMTSGQVLAVEQGTNEVVPELKVATSIPRGINDPYSLKVGYDDVYEVIRKLAELDQLGLSLKPDYDPESLPGGMVFSTYRGVDRTSGQSFHKRIILDPARGNFTDVESINSIADYKNVCWVWPSGITDRSQVGVAYVDGAKDLTGFNRRTMQIVSSTVRVEDYPGNLPSLLQALFIEGLNALINNNYVKLLDGQVALRTEYRYGIDYNLGDILELRSKRGEPFNAMVKEYIRSQDTNGESAYPTLSVIG